MERAPDLLANPLQPAPREDNEKTNVFSDFMEELGLQEHSQHKLTPSHVLRISRDVLSKAPCRSSKDIAWRFLRQIMSLNPNARDSVFCNVRPLAFIAGRGTSLPDISMHLSDASEAHKLSELAFDGSATLHPLDVLCAVLNCSDSFLQQEIVTRLAMCQISVPLLLPASDGANSTLMLWAMRAIMKHLATDTGEVAEENVVDVPLPVFSFVRLGECKTLSKSKILNQVLSLASHSGRKDFVHRQMACGKRSRVISNGLVEMTWFFPTTDCATQPFAVANLHGDIRANHREFKFLAKVSSAVFLLLEDVEDVEDCRESCNEEGAFYVIVGHERNDKSKQFLKPLFLSFDVKGVLMGGEENLEEKIQDIIKNMAKENQSLITLTDMTAPASAIGFSIDENQMDCWYAKLHSLEMTHDISTTVKENEKYLKSLKDVRVQIGNDEKEEYQRMQQGAPNAGQVQRKVHKSLLTYLWSDAITDLVYALTFMSQVQKQYFLKLMWCHQPSTNAFLEEATQGDVFYDLAHVYQAEAMVMKASDYIPRCSQLPTTAADLLLDGFPLVLMSEDTFSVPLEWINDVLTDLGSKSRGPCRVRVISALGVYGTGKSSLLYAMFALQFQVTRPQPTRGALINLIKLDGGFKEELGCDFLLVIDTEGLRAPKLTSAKERYERDNALAAFIIGISDTVIFSLSSESPSDTIDTLQMAVCALLRMRNLGRRPTFYFAQSNVTNSSSDGEDIKDKIHECLNETFDLAAKAIKRASFLSFNDVFKCDFFSSHWYNLIPEMWQKDPFNGGIKCRYAEKVLELKQHLIRALTQESNDGRLRTMQDFIDDIKRMWNAVNLEPILKFQNIKEFLHYSELSDLFWEVERGMHKEMSHWMSSNDAKISLSQGALKKNMLKKLQKHKQEKIHNFKLNLDSDNKQFEEEFTEKFDLLSEELEAFYNDKCVEMQILSRGMETALVEDFCSADFDPDELEPNFDFDFYWKDKVIQLELKMLEELDIQGEFIRILKKEMRGRGSLVTEVLNGVEKSSKYPSEILAVDENHIDASWFTKGTRDQKHEAKRWTRLSGLVRFVTKKCNRYVQSLVTSKKVYEPVHCFDLLRMINKAIKKEAFPFTDLFEVELKLHVLRRAAAAFQETQKAQIKGKEEKLDGEKGKLPPVNALKSIIQDKHSAKRFCHLCLKPAMERHVTATLRPGVLRDVVRTVGVVRKSRRTSPMLYAIKGCHLLNIYSQFSPDCDAQAKAISSTIAIFRQILQRHGELELDDINVLMAELCGALANELPSLQSAMVECRVPVTSSTPQQFSGHVDFFLRRLKNELKPNADDFRILILRVCKRLFGWKTQSRHCAAPYDAGFRRHQRSTTPLRKKSKIKRVEPRPKEPSAHKADHLPPSQSSRHEEGLYFWRIKPAGMRLPQPGIPPAHTARRLKLSLLDTHRQMQRFAYNLLQFTGCATHLRDSTMVHLG